MTEEETKTFKSFISEEVSKVLWGRVLIVATFFGVVNGVTLWSLWNNLMIVAQTKAEAEVTRRADQVINLASERTAKLDAQYDDLLTKVGETIGEMKQLQIRRGEVEAELVDMSKDASALQQKIVDIAKSDAGHLADVLNRLKNLPPDSKGILESFTELKPQVEKLKIEVASKVSEDAFRSAIIDKVTQDALRLAIANTVSLSKIYRIKSITGDVYQGIYNGKPEIGQNIAVGAASNHTTAMYWTFTEGGP